MHPLRSPLRVYPFLIAKGTVHQLKEPFARGAGTIWRATYCTNSQLSMIRFIPWRRIIGWQYEKKTVTGYILISSKFETNWDNSVAEWTSYIRQMEPLSPVITLYSNQCLVIESPSLPHGSPIQTRIPVALLKALFCDRGICIWLKDKIIF